jgi:hypothetical protein
MCESPRVVNGKEGPGLFTGELAIDDDDPTHVYHINLFDRDMAPDYSANHLGAEAQFDDVSIVATEVETQLRENQVEEFDDPWWLMSVREVKTLRTPLDHYDDGRTRISNMGALEKQVDAKSAAEEKQQAAKDQARADKGEELALAAQWGKKKRVAKSAWATEKKANRYTDGHTKVFEKYNTVELKSNVASALKLYLEVAVVEKKRLLLEEEPEYERDKYAHIKELLGGDDALQKMAEDWDKLARTAKKNGDDEGPLSILNVFSLDFIEACEMGNVVKVVSILAVGKGNPNAKIGDDPIFLYLFNKILNIDVLYTPDEVELAVLADGDMKVSKKMSKRIDKRGTFLANFGGGSDSGRKNFMKVLAVLIKFKCDIDALGGENMSALHLAGQFNNSVMAKWVLDRGGNPETRALTSLRETPLMIAARFGAVTTVAALVVAGAKLAEVDEAGDNALHYAAMYGQTQSALFLLRVGIAKAVRNKEGKQAAECATEIGFHSTAQAIMGHARPIEKVAPVMEYLIEEGNRKEPVSLLQGITNAFKNVQEALANFSFKKVWKWILQQKKKITLENTIYVLKNCWAYTKKYTKQFVAWLRKPKEKVPAENADEPAGESEEQDPVTEEPIEGELIANPNAMPVTAMKEDV